MSPKILKIGIATAEEFRTLTRTIARGEKGRGCDEPKVWFESLQSAAQVLGGENKKLLQTILDRHPASIKELEEMTGRKSSSLSRTLKTMERYGIVSLTKVRNQVRPVVNATEFQIEFGLNRHSA
jgi:predicted transcriptional regulator